MVRAKKSLGQNFLMHARIAERMVQAATLPEAALVLEIGPGTGVLTRALLKAGHRVVAIEADGELVSELEASFKDELASGKLVLTHMDARVFNPSEVREPYALVANIPYYLTGELFRTFLTSPNQPYSMTFLVQKEVAERIARNGGKESILSLSVAAYGSASYCFTVPRGAFMPPPNVDSAVLTIQGISKSAFSSLEDEERFFTILKAGFAHKRKRLAKNLEGFASREVILSAFSELDLSLNTRAEDLTINTWLALNIALG